MKRILLGGLAVLLSLAGVAIAQQEPPFPGVPTTILVTAEARHGKDVPAVRAEDITVTQGKQRDRVTQLQAIADASGGSQFYLLIDDGLSPVDIGTKMGDLKSFINELPGNVQVGVAYMRNGTAIVAQQPTSDHGQAANKLRLPIGDPGASASPYFSLQDLVKRWSPSPNGVARQVLMITDGIDRYWGQADLNDPYVNAAIDSAQRAGVVVNAIYARGDGHFGHTFWRINFGQSFLSEIADATGGEAYYLANDSPVAFTPYLNEIRQRMAHQYLLTFQAQPGSKPGLQPIKLSTEIPNLEIVGPSRAYISSGS